MPFVCQAGPRMTARTKGVLCILVSAFGFAVMGLCVRLADGDGASLPVFQKSFFRNLVATAVAAAVMARSTNRALWTKGVLPRAAWRPLVGRCVFGTIGIVGNFYALSHIPLGDASMLNKLSPFAAIFASWVFLGEKLLWRQGVAVVLAFLGALFVVKPGFAFAGEGGAAMAGLIGGVAAGFAYTCVRQLGLLAVPSALIVLIFSLFSTVSMIPFLLMKWTPMTGGQLLILLGAGLSAAVGQFGITAAYRFARSRELAAYDYMNVVFSLVLGFVVLGQIPDRFSCLGMVLIVLTGLWLARRR